MLSTPIFLNTLTKLISDHSTIFCLLRWGVIFVIVLCWPILIKIIKTSQECAVNWKAERWCIAAWLIIFELLVCENIIGKLIHLI
jgi:hypothetical protein